VSRHASRDVRRSVSSDWAHRCSNFFFCLDMPTALGFTHSETSRGAAWSLLRSRVADGTLPAFDARHSGKDLKGIPTSVMCPWLRHGPTYREGDTYLGAALTHADSRANMPAGVQDDGLASLQLRCLANLLAQQGAGARAWEIGPLFGDDKPRRYALQC
jgi:hypothetical protein